MLKQSGNPDLSGKNKKILRVIFFLAIVMALIAWLPKPVIADEIVWEYSTGLNSPTDADRLPNGNTLIADWQNNRIIEVTGAGTIVWEYSSGPYSTPADADRLPNGNTLIADYGNHRVIEVNPAGTIVWEYNSGLIANPKNVDRLSNGNTLSADYGNGVTIEVTTAGTLVWEYSTGISRASDADRLPNGNTLITDANNHRIIEVTPDSTIVWEYVNGLAYPRDADRLSNGNTLIADYFNSRVIEVTPDCTIVWEYGDVAWPEDADRLSNGNTLITDYGNHRIIEVGSEHLLDVIVPDGGEQWMGGTDHNIVWDCFNPGIVDHYRLLFSTDGGSSYQDTIAYNIPPTDTCYTWTVPSITTCYSCKVKIQALDSLENIIAEDQSNDVFTILPAPVIASSQYPMFSYNLARTGRSPCYGSLLDNIKWSFETESPITSSPVIAPDGTIYFTSENDTLYALDVDGTRKWTVWLGTATASTPAIGVDSTIYIGSDGKLSAYESDGELKWEYEVSGSVVSSPVGFDGAIYFGSTNDTLYAVNTDGTLRWKYAAGGDILSSPAVTPYGIIYVGSDDHKLHAVNPDGTEHWKVSTDAAIISSPAVDNSTGIIYVGSCDGILYAIDPEYNGSIINGYITGDTITSSPAIGADGTIYFGSYDGKLYAINPDFSLKWEYQTGDKISSSPTISSNRLDNREFVYVGSDDSTFYCLNGSDGTVIWSASTNNIIRSSPAIADSCFTVYIGSNDGNLYAFGPDPDVAAVIIAPNGGEQWLSNTVYDIYWATPGGATSIALQYSLTSGAPPWHEIAIGEIDDGVFPWTTPDITCSTCRVKVNAFYTSGDSAVDISDADFSIGEVGVEDEEPQVPRVFALNQNYPNPLDPQATISYSLPKSCKVSLKIYNIKGQLVETIVDDFQQPGYYSVVWNGKNDNNESVYSGIYLYRIRAGDFMDTKKCVILK